MATVGAAPCQCFSPGGIQIVSPGRDLGDLATPGLDKAEAGEDVQRLAEGVGVPVGAGARLEGHDDRAQRAGSGASITRSCRTRPVK